MAPLFHGLTLGAIYALLAIAYTLVYGAAAGERLHLRAPRRSIRLGFVLAAVGLAAAAAGAVVSAAARGAAGLAFLRAALPAMRDSFGALEACVLGAAFAALAAQRLFLKRTAAGLALRACSDDRETAALSGIDARLMLAVALGLGVVGAGLGGGLSAFYHGGAGRGLLLLPVKGLVAALVGRLGNGRGAVIGGMCLGLLEVVVAAQVDGEAEARDAVAFTALIASVVLARRYGLPPDRDEEAA